MSIRPIFKLRLSLPATMTLLLILLLSACNPTPTPAPGIVAVANTPTPTPAPNIQGIPDSLLNNAGSSADIWIEFPQQGQVLPAEPLTITIVASSNNSIESVSLAINGEELPTGTLTDTSKDNSMTMVRLEQIWQPTEQGEYTLSAQVSSTSGTSNTSVTFCIISCDTVFDIAPTDTPTPAPQDSSVKFWADPTSFPAGTCTTLHWQVPADAQMVSLGDDLIDFANVHSKQECLCEGRVYTLNVMLADSSTVQQQLLVTVTGDCTQPEETEIVLNFWAEPESIDAGNCTELNWEVEGLKSVLLNGNAVNFAGTDQECPCSNTTYTLSGVKPDGTTESRTVTVNVTGSCELPITEPPSEPPPADTVGPEYEWTDVVFEDCKVYGQALIADASGINSAKFFYNLDNEGWHSLWMEDIGGGIWQSEVGITINDGMSTPIGSLQYKVQANDPLMNESTSPIKTKEFNSCSG